MSSEALAQFDLAPTVQRLLCRPSLDLLMEALSTAGEGWFLALVAVGVAWKTNLERRQAIRCAIGGLAGLGGTGVLVAVIKRIVNEPRPLQVLGPGRVRVLLEPLRFMSFPSGHAAASAALAFWASRSSARSRVWPWLLASLVGLSRVYVGAHWVTDVVGGWLLGLAVAAAVERLMPRPQGAGLAPSGGDK